MSLRPSFKNVVAFSHRFSRVPLAALLVIVLVLSTVVAWAWDSAGIGFLFGLLSLVDGLMLVALPRFQKSFGPPQLPWISLIVLRWVPTLVGAWAPAAWALVGLGAYHLALSVSATYACWIEPTRLGVTRITLSSTDLQGCPPLSVLQISDLHVERITKREERLLELVHELAPDVIVLTGDYLNISYTNDPLAMQQARALLKQLHAPHGVFAITGSPSVDSPALVRQLLEGLDIIWLRDQVRSLTWRGCPITIAGVECSYNLDLDENKLRHLLNGRRGSGFTLLLYHTPDVMPVAVQLGVDLYLAGHTHGGQLRLPWFGAMATASQYGKRYEMGLYREGGATLYVSRGVGLEGAGAPRARFLCPPELVLFALTGATD
jgi:predicted MPP superfamily phosphohydrolase